MGLESPPEFQVEMVGHASLRVQSGGKTLLTDPWYVDPIDCNTQFHWPPLVHTIEQLARETDAIWISHIHPDHFDPLTLRQFPRSIPIYIGEYKLKAFRDEIRSLGFQVVEVPFQRLTQVSGTDFQLAILESDYAESAAYDSSVLIQAPGFTVFNNNDCFLKDEKYEWVKRSFQVDYAFLGFSPASYFPICFEFEPETMNRLLGEAADRRYGDFLGAARILCPRLAVPFAMGIRFLHESLLRNNAQFNSATEAVQRARRLGMRSEVLLPGDQIVPRGEIRRRRPLPSEAEDAAALREYALQRKPELDAIWEREPPASPDVIPRFRDWMIQLWKRSQSAFPEVRGNVIAYRILGPQGGEFYFDFSRSPEDIFVDGHPAAFDMRYTYLDRMLQWRLDGKIDWDELHFSNRVSVCQRRYADRFYAMLRTEEGASLKEA